LKGQIDIDPDDKDLMDEMMMLRYKFSSLGSIQIESKDDMKSRGVHSPDNLDAAVYASVNLDNIFNSPFGDSKVGDRILMDPEIQFQSESFYGSWVW